jgi:hypothetical protein
MSSFLKPVVDLEVYIPENTAFMARTSSAETRLLGYSPLQSETLASHTMGLFPGRSTVRPLAAVTEEVLSLFEASGILVAEKIRTFSDLGEAESSGLELARSGHKLAYIYPLSKEVFQEDDLWVPRDLYHFLNAKRSLFGLVPEEHRAHRYIASICQLRREGYQKPVFLKYADASATGWGFAVRGVRLMEEFSTALDTFESMGCGPSTELVVEAYEQVETCWCASLAIADGQSECFGGAEQLFAAAARQSGSVIDPDNAFPSAAAQVCRSVAERARKMGYRGFAGIDIGRTVDGRLLIFDLNFRVNASTAQLVYHAAACDRSGLAASRSFNCRAGGPFKVLAGKLRPELESGRLILTRVIDAAFMPLAEGRHFVDGFVLGRDRSDAEAQALRLHWHLAGPS